MEFRPCIDIHNGKVKQIVGGSLKDQGDQANVNFETNQDAAFFATLYKSYGIRGGHIILLNPVSSEYYEATRTQALHALNAYPGGMQIGGGITLDNAKDYLNAGASHVIVTSYVFKDGKINWERLSQLRDLVGKEHLVLDLSCRKKEDAYYIVTDRWQKFTDTKLDEQNLDILSDYCDEYLIHAVDVEGKAAGIETKVASLLGKWEKTPTTYAGGVHSFEDLQLLKELGNNHVNVTIGSALDLFGGTMKFEDVMKFIAEEL